MIYSSGRFRRLVAAVAGSFLALPGTAAVPVAAVVVMHPAVSDFVQINASETPPTEAQCQSVGRRCFTPQAIQSAYNVGPLYAAGLNGRGVTIAIVDSFGSDTIAHDLHVFDKAFGLQPMCGEEGITCAPGMPIFSQLHVQGQPPTNSIPGAGSTGQETHDLWSLEVSLDVETSHAMAPMANILLVTTPTAETLGVQGFPDMMKAEQVVVDNHLASVISQSFGSSENAFGNAQSLLNLRDAFTSAAASGVTVLASSGDNGTAEIEKTPVKQQSNPFPVAVPIPFPTVGWPASDPLVTGVGGTYLCTDPTAPTNEARTITPGSPGKCAANPAQAEVGWTFSGGGFSRVFSTPAYQNTLPAGSTPIGTMRGVPDVALQASAGTGALIFISLPPEGLGGLVCDPVTKARCSTGWYDIGGTSLSCPQWAALVAIADQKHGSSLGFINPKLYSIASDPAKYAADFFDVTKGNNTNPNSVPIVPGYPATTGWDPVTGLGTPNAANLVKDLAS